MKKWAVMIEVYASTLVVVEAETEEAARDAAYETAHVSVCHQCSDHLEVGDLGDVLEINEVQE